MQRGKKYFIISKNLCRFELSLRKWSWLDEYKARKKVQKTYFKNKGNLNLHLNFFTNFHKTFTFHDYLLQFTLKKKLVKLQVSLNLYSKQAKWYILKFRTYLEPQKLSIFELQLCCALLIIKIAKGLETLFSWYWGPSVPITHIFWETVCQYILK